MGGSGGRPRREEMIMTQDKARKTATRQRMAETGEPYSVARHAVENEAAEDSAPETPVVEGRSYAEQAQELAERARRRADEAQERADEAQERAERAGGAASLAEEAAD